MSIDVGEDLPPFFSSHHGYSCLVVNDAIAGDVVPAFEELFLFDSSPLSQEGGVFEIKVGLIKSNCYNVVSIHPVILPIWVLDVAPGLHEDYDWYSFLN